MTKMSAKRHLRELQWRLMIVAGFFIVGAGLAYYFQSYVVPFLLNPLNGEKLVYLTPGGGFSFIFLISIYSGIALAFPVFMQQLYAFLRPALPEAARKKSAVIITASFALLAAGLAFGYFVAVPSALTFLYGFADQYVSASLTAESYLNFMIAYTIGIGIVFQLPLLLLLIHTIKPLTPGGLGKSEKWVILAAFIIAAIITPTPDPINQAIIAGPVIVIYQFGVIAVLIAIIRSRSKTRRAEKAAAAQQSAAPTQPVLSHTPSFYEEVLEADPELEMLLQTARYTPEVPPQVTRPAQAPLHRTPTVKGIDGFTPVSRGALPALTPIKKEAVKPLSVSQPSRRPKTTGFSMDGMTVRRPAAGF